MAHTNIQIVTYWKITTTIYYKEAMTIIYELRNIDIDSNYDKKHHHNHIIWPEGDVFDWEWYIIYQSTDVENGIIYLTWCSKSPCSETQPRFIPAKYIEDRTLI